MRLLDALRLLARRAALRISRRDARGLRDAAGRARRTWPGKAPPRAIPTASRTRSAQTLEHELALIARARLRALFPHRARHRPLSPAAQDILCQGRGSAANSVGLLLPRHHRGRSRARSTCCSSASSRAERDEPPDIDVDFEHERREEVIQYIYEKYGRERAGIAATVITYRGRSADPRGRQGDRPVRRHDRRARRLDLGLVGGTGVPASRSAPASASTQSDRARSRCIALADEIIGFPRHLSQHVGGFVITREPARRGGADRERRDGRAHRHRMGQGRSRRARHPQGRRAGARHADLPAPRLRAAATSITSATPRCRLLATIPAEERRRSTT